MTARHRTALPQLDAGLFVTDGGLETDLIFHEGIELPEFAAFTLLDTDAGLAALRRYYARYVQIAGRHGAGLVLETPTWRASARWGAALGYDAAMLADSNRRAVALMEEIRATVAGAPVVISGNIGPQDDAYAPDDHLSAEEAEAYHAVQIQTFAETAADLVSAFTLTYVDEAVGIVRAAGAAAISAVISFTVETDGRLPSGQSLAEAIEEVDARTSRGPAYYMVNCAHPTHFEAVLDGPGPWERIRGLRANASTCSHAELDEATELDEGDPADLAARYAGLRARLPELTVLGGCCGTDHRHVAAICAEWRRPAATPR